jgi:chromate transporter
VGRRAGIAGALAAVTGTVLPTTLLMLVVIIFFFGVKDSPRMRAMLTAVRPVVVALLLWIAYDMGRTAFASAGTSLPELFARNWDKAALALVAFALLVRISIPRSSSSAQRSSACSPIGRDRLGVTGAH